jgi:hypothetical protein
MRKISNRILIIVLVALVGIFALARVFRAPRLEGNLRKELVRLDTAKVTEIRIQRSGPDSLPLSLKREGPRWFAEQQGRKYGIDPSSVKGVLGTLSLIQAERMASRRKDKWDNFNVGDNGTRVSVYTGDRAETELTIGKTGFNQARPDPNNPYGGFGGAYTYVRLTDEDEVYTVDGFLESTFARSLNDWRDKAFLRIARDKITKVTFIYPGDSSFVLEKQDTVWTAGGRAADKAKVEGWLNQLTYKNLNEFADSFNPLLATDASVVINAGEQVIGKVEAWKNGAEWVLRSALQPEVTFSSAGSSVARDLFIKADRFASVKN